MTLYITDEAELGLEHNFFKTVLDIIYKELNDDRLIEREISLLLADDETIQELNKSYRNMDKPTDVLSFEIESDTMLGDIIISVETAKRMAVEYSISLDREIAFLFIHGILHLLGYDHETSAEDEEEMFALQTKLLDLTNIA